MELEPKLIDVAVPPEPKGVVLILHGGASRRDSVAVSPTQLSVLRMVPIAKRIARAGQGELAVFRLLNSRRGWDTGHTPVDDAHWALDRMAERLEQKVPACVVGHSLGGRAAILTADRAEVRGTVALAPWVYATDAPGGRVEGPVVIVHGSNDRIANPQRSREMARRISGSIRTTYVFVRGARHAMLRRHGVFSSIAAGFATETLLGRSDSDLVRRIRGGEPYLEV